METTRILEPSAALLKGRSPLRVTKRLCLATRPKFFAASILPVIVGTAWGYHAGDHFDLAIAMLALAATVCIHAGANVLNDVFDELSGSDRVNVDRIYPYTGGSRFIQNDVMSVSEMSRWGIVLLAAAIALGTILIVLKGAAVLWFGLAGIALGTLYSMPPVQLSAHGFGEAAVALAFGALPVTGAAWLQSGIVDTDVLLVSVPISLWVAAILLINEVPDINADASVGKRTLAVRLGAGGTQKLYLVIHAFALLAIGLAIANGLLPVLAILLPSALFLIAARVGRGIRRGREQPETFPRAIELTLAIHMLGCLWLAGWVWYAA
jgi:1,4-dihydroxy-2-naphthoate octaprenyltransferase